MSTLAAPAVLCALVLSAPALAAPQAPDEVLATSLVVSAAASGDALDIEGHALRVTLAKA